MLTNNTRSDATSMRDFELLRYSRIRQQFPIGTSIFVASPIEAIAVEISPPSDTIVGIIRRDHMRCAGHVLPQGEKFAERMGLLKCSLAMLLDLEAISLQPLKNACELLDQVARSDRRTEGYRFREQEALRSYLAASANSNQRASDLESHAQLLAETRQLVSDLTDELEAIEVSTAVLGNQYLTMSIVDVEAGLLNLMCALDAFKRELRALPETWSNLELRCVRALAQIDTALEL